MGKLEKNKAVVRSLLEEAYNQGNLDVIDEVCAADYTWPIGNPQVHSSEEMKEHVAGVRTTFPDIHITAEDMIAEGDKVVTRWTIVATHKGELKGIPPTGVQVTFTGILISRIDDGKIAGDWENSDALGLMQQLGVIPPKPGTLPALDRKGEDFLWGPDSPVTGAPGDPETNKAITLREAEEIWNQGNLAVIDEIYATTFVNHDPCWPAVRDFKSYKQWFSMVRTPDIHLTIDDLVAEGDKVACRWTSTFTEPASGVKVTIPGIIIFRFADGKIVEMWWAKDFLGLVQQIGVIPPMGQGGE